MVTAIKPVYDRKAKAYTVDVKEGDYMFTMLAQQGYYVTDNVAATLGRITAGRCAWYSGLKPEQREAVLAWLMDNVK
jgi:hypothetical protein